MSVGSQQLVLVSKAHKQSVKQLYKLIFRLHKSLPQDMRELGDKYVRNEFKLHKSASPEHTKVFLGEWANYTRLLMRQANPRMNEKFGADLDPQKLDDFKDDQIGQLYQLFVEIKRFDPVNENSNKK